MTVILSFSQLPPTEFTRDVMTSPLEPSDFKADFQSCPTQSSRQGGRDGRVNSVGGSWENDKITVILHLQVSSANCTILSHLPTPPQSPHEIFKAMTANHTKSTNQTLTNSKFTSYHLFPLRAKGPRRYFIITTM